jgi:HPt (histidine-containing phosphotransfer) domain-containing protein
MTESDRAAALAASTSALELPIDEVLERLAGDRTLFSVLADLHRRESLIALEHIRGLLASGDAAGVERAAHRLAGSLLVFSADGAVTLARRIEHIASTGELTSANQHFAALEFELHRVNAALERVVHA